MKKISNIGSLLKKIYRLYSGDLLVSVQRKGFLDLRPSFLEVLIFIAEKDGPTIKEIGFACGLKKQTMTSHLNELVKRGYIERKTNLTDKREQCIYLTDYGKKFKLSLVECVDELEHKYSSVLGEVELDRTELLLNNFYNKIFKLK